MPEQKYWLVKEDYIQFQRKAKIHKELSKKHYTILPNIWIYFWNRPHVTKYFPETGLSMRKERFNEVAH